jgi:hypothetical protein
MDTRTAAAATVAAAMDTVAGAATTRIATVGTKRIIITITTTVADAVAGAAAGARERGSGCSRSGSI